MNNIEYWAKLIEEDQNYSTINENGSQKFNEGDILISDGDDPIVVLDVIEKYYRVFPLLTLSTQFMNGNLKDSETLKKDINELDNESKYFKIGSLAQEILDKMKITQD